jgi:hypothetical protein
LQKEENRTFKEVNKVKKLTDEQKAEFDWLTEEKKIRLLSDIEIHRFNDLNAIRQEFLTPYDRFDEKNINFHRKHFR